MYNFLDDIYKFFIYVDIIPLFILFPIIILSIFFKFLNINKTKNNNIKNITLDIINPTVIKIILLLQLILYIKILKINFYHGCVDLNCDYHGYFLNKTIYTLLILIFFIIYDYYYNLEKNIKKTPLGSWLIISYSSLLPLFSGDLYIHQIIFLQFFVVYIYIFMLNNNTKNFLNGLKYLTLSLLLIINFFLILIFLNIIQKNTLIYGNNFSFWDKNSILNILLICLLIFIVFLNLGVYPLTNIIYTIYFKLKTNLLVYMLTVYKFIFIFWLINILLRNNYTIIENNFYVMYTINILFFFLIVTLLLISFKLLRQNTFIKFIIINSFISLVNFSFIILLIIVSKIYNYSFLDYLNLLYIYLFFSFIIIFIMYNFICIFFKNKLFIFKKNTNIMVFLWIILSFPPLILFMLKFYIVYYTVAQGWWVVGFLLFILNSIIITVGYIKNINHIVLKQYF